MKIPEENKPLSHKIMHVLNLPIDWEMWYESLPTNWQDILALHVDVLEKNIPYQEFVMGWESTELQYENKIGQKFINKPFDLTKIGELTYLYLRNCQLNEFPSQICQLKNLQSIDLLKNDQLTSLPSEIGNLSNLTNLILYGCQLNTLPAEIGNLSNLQILDLSYNQFSFLPKEIGNLSNLHTLVLKFIPLTTLPKEIGNLNNLEILELVCPFVSLPPAMGKLSKLRELSLYLYDYEKFAPLPKEIENLKNLQKFLLQKKQFPRKERPRIKMLLPNCEVIFNG